MPNDPFYKTKAWRELRAQRLAIDNHRCTVPGCNRGAVVVDHLVPHSLSLADLRSLCREHDNQVKEDQHGRRRRGGQFVVHGCDADGNPIDPNHWWKRP
ncbi:conserved protein of unknown function [Magnetospirillum sp. XM-1]|uniref:hypothetical protein n=1 Tax=Magnetospirillum sp. XM-1 TaxID=1663591 RepID=UPI00073DC9FE|nr:hypothetical protein [Magnetospirillum sp. XM-1]CUW39293.1 conserved protein of unknown function [Magnetospirillum sp. XM-1]